MDVFSFEGLYTRSGLKLKPYASFNMLFMSLIYLYHLVEFFFFGRLASLYLFGFQILLCRLDGFKF